MIVAPPSEAGAFHDRVTWAVPAVAVRPVGGPGFITRACGPCMAVRTMPDPDSGGPAAPPPTSSAGQPARTAARHAPATVLSHRRPGPRAGRSRLGVRPGRHLLVRRKDFMRTPADVASRCLKRKRLEAEPAPR